MFWASVWAAMLNPSVSQEQVWQAQRIAALEARAQALREVLRLRDLDSRRRYETQRHFTNMFNPNRLADGQISCAMRITREAAHGAA
jgi:hypothetical protein